MGQVLTAPCHINFIKLQLRNWTDLLELCEQQKIDEIRTVEHEEPVQASVTEDSGHRISNLQIILEGAQEVSWDKEGIDGAKGFTFSMKEGTKIDQRWNFLYIKES